MSFAQAIQKAVKDEWTKSQLRNAFVLSYGLVTVIVYLLNVLPLGDFIGHFDLSYKDIISLLYVVIIILPVFIFVLLDRRYG